MSKAIRVSDLRNQIGTPEPRPFLHCPRCGNLCSANAGDYFAARVNTVFRCCGANMQLVTVREVFTEVSPSECAG